MLGTGKIDYIQLSTMVMQAEQEGSGWIQKIGNSVKKTAPESSEELSPEE